MLTRLASWKRSTAWKSLFMITALLAVVSTGCRVRQTEEGEMPDVNVEVKGGNVPEYDVDTAEVDVKTRTEEIEVPDVDIKTEKREIKVPDIDVTMPEESPKPPQS